jgi:uncharacterized protein YbcI
MVVVVMHGTLTTAERSLVADGQDEAVLRVRRDVNRMLRERLIEAVETLTGSTVTALLSDTSVEADIAVVMFVLDRAVTSGTLAPPPNA